MAKRKRDYKAEYARSKARSQSRGYTGPRQEKRARKAVGLTRGFPSLRFDELPDFAIEQVSGRRIARMREEARYWSDNHSHVKASRYSGNMSNDQVEQYHAAYVQQPDTYRDSNGKPLSRRMRAKEKKIRIYRYLTGHGYTVEGGPEDWKSDRGPA
jgi:hypothetical protein